MDSIRLRCCLAFSKNVRSGGNGIVLLLDFSHHTDVFATWVCNFCIFCLRVFLQLVSGIRGMAQQRDLFSDLLRTADYMKAFVSQCINNEEELRLRLEQAEASLSAVQDDNEALRMELAEAKSREESTDARLLEAEDEMTSLREEVRQLRTEVSIEKKQREDLQLRLLA